MKSITMRVGALLAGLLSGALVWAGDIRLPPIERATLANGLTVLFMERHEVPLVAMAWVSPAGAVYDGPRAGLANLTADALVLGSRQFDKKTLHETLEAHGARMSAHTQSDMTVISSDFARADLPVLLPMFADVVLHPRFDEKEFVRLQQRTLDGLKQAKESPRRVIQAYFKSQAYADGAYANPPGGRVSAVAALARTDAQAFYLQHYRPENSAIVVVGDFDQKAVRRALEQHFGQWKATSPAPHAPNRGHPRPAQGSVWVVDKPDAIETTFMLGGPGIARNDPDYVPLMVINTVLGGRFTSWLNDELRVNSGLTYGARSEFLPLGESGVFALSSFTATAKTQPALDLALKTYQKLWENGIDYVTLESAKAYVKGQFPPRLETNAQLAGWLADLFVYRLDPAQVNGLNAAIDGLTVERARALIDAHFPKTPLNMVLIGRAEAVLPVAERYGTVTRLTLTDDGFVPQQDKESHK